MIDCHFDTKIYLKYNYERESDGEEAPEKRCVVPELVSEAPVPAGLGHGAVGRERQREVHVALQLPVVLVLVQQLGQEFRSECYQEPLHMHIYLSELQLNYY